MMSTRASHDTIPALGMSLSTTKSGPTCAKEIICPEIANLSTTFEEYGVRRFAMVIEDSKKRAVEYGFRVGTSVDFATALGIGQEGFVRKTGKERASAIKVFDPQRNYLNEIEIDLILESHEVSEIKGFTIPKLIDFDDELWIIKLSIASPPYLRNFGKASVGFPPPFTAEQMLEYETERKQLFGRNWVLV